MSSSEQSPTASERTPLIARDEETSPETTTKKKSRLPSFIALGALCVLVICAIVFGFATPAAVEEYAKEAITFKIDTVSIDSITDTGINARVQGDVWLDGSKVQKKAVRDLGRFATWIAREIEIGESRLEIYLPEYDDALLGTVDLPAIVINIRNGQHNWFDMAADIQPGDANGLKNVALDFMDGKQMLDVKAIAIIPVKSGIINMGTQKTTVYQTVKAGDGKLPEVDVKNMQIAEYGAPGKPSGIITKADASAMNPYPVQFDTPPLSFDVMLPDCEEQPLMLGSMNIGVIHMMPKQIINVSVTGFMHELPAALTKTCPGSTKSPLDSFIGSYLSGNDTKILIRGGEQSPETPQWIGDILKDVVVPVPVPTHPFENSIKNFSMSNVDFSMPDYITKFEPTVSATVNVVVGLPKDVNIDVSVNGVRSTSEMYYQGEKLGDLDLHKWQKASSTKIGDDLHVSSTVVDAPLKITSQEVFSKVLRAVIFKGEGLEMEVRAIVDVSSITVLGEFEVRQIPAKGKIFIKPMEGKMEQEVKDIAIVGSSPEELIMQTTVLVNNPTEYTAHLPYVNISVSCNGTHLGYAWGSFDMGPGWNTFVVNASYNNGPVAAELLSQFISGWNVTATLSSHPGSAPGLPDPQLSMEVPLPHTFGKFMRETTMHIFSSTCTFVLFSPLPMTITSIDAKSYYKGIDIGTISYDEEIEIAVGSNETPQLPVDWNFNGGLDFIKKAIGGELKLDAHAKVSVRMGQYRTKLWYEAIGLGAKVRFLMEEAADGRMRLIDI